MDLLATPARRKFLFAVLYLAEGAPVGFLWWTLPVKLRLLDTTVAEISTMVGWLVLPWSLKFLWAPLVDVLRSPRWGLRAWIITAQIAMGATLLPLVWLELSAHLGLAWLLILAHTFAATMQDVAIDALAIRVTAPGERGALNAWMQAGMLLGRAAFGSLALVFAARLDLGAVVAVLVATIWSTTALMLLVREPDLRAPAAPSPLRTFGRTLRRAFSTRRTWLGLAFAATGGAAFEAVGVVVGPYLADRGFTEAGVGRWWLLSVVCMTGGGLLGGYLADRWGKRAVAGLSLAAMSLVIWAVAGTDPGAPVADAAARAGRIALLGLLYVGVGQFVAASYALFMDLTDARLGGTQFSAFMGATNFCEFWAAMAMGWLLRWSGNDYAVSMASMAVVALLALPLLAWIREGAERTPSPVAA